MIEHSGMTEKGGHCEPRGSVWRGNLTLEKRDRHGIRVNDPRDDIMKELCTPSGSEVYYH